MAKNALKMLIRGNVEAVLKELPIGGMWMPAFGWYEKTGEYELTLMVRIYQQSVDTDKCLEKVEGVIKSMGWKFKIDRKVKDAGGVSGHYLSE